jgi:hypothetical protein
MTDIPIPEDRLRQFLEIARFLGASSITRADVAESARAAGHIEFGAQIEASAVKMGREALSATIFLESVLGSHTPDDTTVGE